MKLIKRCLGLCLTAAAFVGTTAAAQAAQIECSGNYLLYQFNVSAAASGGRVTSQIHIVITGPNYNRNGYMRVTSGDIRPRQYLRFSGSNSEGGGSIAVTYDASSGRYNGNLQASSSLGSVDVPVVCTMSSADEDFVPDPE